MGSDQDIFRQHLQGYPSDFVDMCDIELIVEQHRFPVHSQRIAAASAVLGGCITAAKGSQPAERPESLLQVPLQDSADIVQELVKLLYTRKLTQHLYQMSSLSEKGRELLQQVLEAADKYAMEELIDSLDLFLSSKASSEAPITWPSSSELISWAELAGAIPLPSFLEQCERQLRDRPDLKLPDLGRMPVDSSLRIIQGLLHRITETEDKENRPSEGRQCQRCHETRGLAARCRGMVRSLQETVSAHGHLPHPSRK